MKKIIFLLIVPIFFGFRTGQEFNEKRMERDLEIAKNILSTLIKSSSESFFGGSSIEASYIKDYGVIFNIPEHLVYFHSGPSGISAVPEAPLAPEVDVKIEMSNEFMKQQRKEIQEQKEFIEQEKKKAEKEKQKIKEKALQEHMMQEELTEKELEHVKEEARAAAREREALRAESRARARAAMAEDRARREVYVTSGKNSKIDWEEIMFTFLADYADLIGQLQPDEKIIVNQKSPYDDLIYIWNGTGVGDNVTNEKAGLSMEVLRKDVSAYKMGKINREEFNARVIVKKNEPQKKIPDLEMFASIFDRYYSYDLSETYYCDGKPRYEVLDGFGVVFHIKATSASKVKSRVYFYSPGDTWQMEPDTGDQNDDGLYPKFKEDIKAFMLDYGRTIRSLDDEEKVMLEISISSCRDCKVPKTLEISSEMSLLKKYDQQKITREKAMAAIEMKEQF